MCDSTQGSLCPSPMTVHQCMWIQWSILQNTTYIHTYTYILRTYYVHTTYILHTTYRMSDHIVSYWTQFRRDNYWTQFRRDKNYTFHPKLYFSQILANMWSLWVRKISSNSLGLWWKKKKKKKKKKGEGVLGWHFLKGVFRWHIQTNIESFGKECPKIGDQKVGNWHVSLSLYVTTPIVWDRPPPTCMYRISATASRPDI